MRAALLAVPLGGKPPQTPRSIATARSASLRSLLAILLTGCLPQARHHQNLGVPLSAIDVARMNTGDAVVSYLRQRDADPAICVPSAGRPHVVLATPLDLRDLVDGVGRGVRLDKWEACVRGILEVLPPELARVLVDRMLERYVERIVYARLEGDGPLLEQLDALRRTYDERPSGRDPSDEAVLRTVELLEQHEGALTVSGQQFRTALMGVLYVERGLTPDGRRISVATLDRLLSERDEAALLVYSRRVPDARLRSEARTRLVRVRVRTSRYTELRAHENEVVARVLREGRNVVRLEGRPELVTLVRDGFAYRGIAVVQDVGQQSARLLSFVDDERNASVVPPIDLRGAIQFPAPGFRLPITLCAPPGALDPSPCIDSAEIGLAVPFATLENGQFRFSEAISMDLVLQLREQGDELRLPILFRREPVAELRWAMRFSTTGPLLFAPGMGQPGPRVDVDIDATAANVLYTIETGGRRYHAVLEPVRMNEFGVVAAGGQGTPGTPGAHGIPGTDGTNGTNASCPSSNGTNGGNGTAGGPGGHGGPGGNGGPGGMLSVRLRCKTEDCERARQLVAARMTAPGGAAGPGGPGGSGGRGGRGGAGGSGTYCSGQTQADGSQSSGQSLSGGSRGSDGPNGANGMPGPEGRPGPPGRVQIRVEPLQT